MVVFSKIGRKNHYLEILKSKIGRKNRYLEFMKSKAGRKNHYLEFMNSKIGRKNHSWAKFKIVLVTKPEGKLYSFHVIEINPSDIRNNFLRFWIKTENYVHFDNFLILKNIKKFGHFWWLNSCTDSGETRGLFSQCVTSGPLETFEIDRGDGYINHLDCIFTYN